MSSARHELQPWFEARRRFRLSHAEVQMARELGLNPGKFGRLANHDQESWKAPLPVFISDLYRRRFGKDRIGLGFMGLAAIALIARAG